MGFLLSFCFFAFVWIFLWKWRETAVVGGLSSMARSITEAADEAASDRSALARILIRAFDNELSCCLERLIAQRRERLSFR